MVIDSQSNVFNSRATLPNPPLQREGESSDHTLITALFIIAVIFLLRLPSFWTPIMDVDESQFAGFANALLDGGRPYISSLDTKPLGIYWFYAAIFYVFGRNNLIAVHIATAVWVALTAFFCYRITKRIYSPRAGFWAALFYAVFTTAYVPKFIGTSIAILMMLPLTASIDEMLAWEETKKNSRIWFAGLLWGIACLFKYQAGINLVVAGLYLLILHPILIEGSLSKMKIKAFLIFASGGAIVGALFVLYIRSIGVWDDFAFWSLKGSVAYVTAASMHTNFLKSLIIRGGAVVLSGFLLWALAAVRSWHILKDIFGSSQQNEKYCKECLVLIWLIFSLIPVCMGGKFYGHYFLQLYPALCILAAGQMMQFYHAASGRRLIIALVIAGLVIPSIVFFGARLMADQIYSAIREENPRQYIPIADYIKQHTSKDERIFVWGFATPIYTYSDRSAASRFLWCDWLTGRVSGTESAKDPSFDTAKYIVPGSWKMFFEDMEKYKPAYFVDTSPANHHDYGKYPVSKYPDLVKFLKKYYVFETSVSGANIYRRKGNIQNPKINDE